MLRLLGLVSLTLVGCLSPSFEVSGHELDRLARLDPNTRGDAVRAVQRVGRSSRARPKSDEQVDISDGDVALVLPVIRRAPPRARRFRPLRRPRPSSRRVTPSVRVDAAPAETTVRVRGSGDHSGRVFGRGGSRSGSGGSGGGSSGGNGRDAAAVAVVVVVVAAVAAAAGAVALAATEGYRWDGWVQTEPSHPFHLHRRMQDGRRQWLTLRLDQLDPEIAAWADGARVDGREGRLVGLERAPLNRRGFALDAAVMLSSVDVLERMRDFGGGVRVGVGGFPIRYLGLLAFADIQGASDVVNVRVGGELQAFLPPAGRAHFGLYGEGGWLRSRRDISAEETQRRGRSFGGGGLLLQIDLTTRLALTTRGGLWASEGRVFPTFGLGLSVY